ncbi:MAG: hypothetical protein CV045_09315 [Cyanobacteria bacterium M5B4]|nr:MAG: hypothetical protein CV045_09315 [Cyanobacteria bacterium M5B4]
MYNPSMREEPRHRPAGVLPKPQVESILDWLERNGRIAARVPEASITFDEDIDELNEIIGEDSGYYDDDEDDLVSDDDEEVI